MLLGKLQRNQLFEAIKDEGFAPADFDIDNLDTRAGVIHKTTASYFLIELHDPRDPSFTSTNVVDDGLPFETHPMDWGDIAQRYAWWLSSLAEHIEAPDLWAEMANKKAALVEALNEPGENSPFSPDERVAITDELRNSAVSAQETYGLDEGQVRALSDKIDYLVDSLDRVGRIDWKNLLVGVIFGYLLEVALAPDQAQSFMFSLVLAVARFYGHDFPALSIV